MVDWKFCMQHVVIWHTSKMSHEQTIAGKFQGCQCAHEWKWKFHCSQWPWQYAFSIHTEQCNCIVCNRKIIHPVEFVTKIICLLFFSLSLFIKSVLTLPIHSFNALSLVHPQMSLFDVRVSASIHEIAKPFLSYAGVNAHAHYHLNAVKKIY